jgi:hypothetical protein
MKIIKSIQKNTKYKSKNQTKILNIYLKSKKAMATMTLVGIVISLLSMYVISDFIFSTSELTTTTAEDQACKSLILAKDSAAGAITDFFVGIKSQCKTEEFEIKPDIKDDQFKVIADSMAKCWNRYGEGESNFLSSFGSEGNWCFSCAKLSFKEKEKIYDYSNDFIPYTNTNTLKLSNGTKTTYHNYINLRYYDETTSSLADIDSGINEIKLMTEDGDSSMGPLLLSLSEKNQELLDLASKRIDTNENLFVVYRYDTIPEGTMEIMLDTLAGVAIGTGAGIAIESVLFWGAGVILAPVTGGASLAVAAVATAAKVAKTSKTGKRVLNVYEQMEKIFQLTAQSIKFSKAQKIIKVFQKFDGSIENLAKLGTKLKNIAPDLSDKITNIQTSFNKLGIKNIDELSEKLLEKKDSLKHLQDATDQMIDNKVLTGGKTLDLIIQSEAKLVNQIDELKFLANEMSKVKDITKLTATQKKAHIENMRTYTKTLAGVAGAVTGGKVAANYNSENIQYVDLLNQEQYYRLCGTEPIITK